MSTNDTTQRRLESLRSRREKVESQITAFNTDPGGEVSEQVAELDSRLEIIDPRQPEKQENRSMYDHLQKMKEGIKQDPDAYVRWRVSRLESKSEALKNEINELEVGG